MSRRTVTDKVASQRNGAAATIDPRQLELALGHGAKRANGVPAPVADSADVERARTIVESLDQLSSEQVFEAFEKLDTIPPEAVCEALGVSGEPARLDEAIRRAHGFPEPPLRLRTLSIVKDADIFDLGPVAEEQLRLAGKGWDGRDLSPEERLDEEVEGSFAGTLEHRVLADAEAPAAAPLFDVLLYAGEAGSIFRAGTTELVGAISYDAVEMKDRRARVAVQVALASPVVEPVAEAVLVEEPAAPVAPAPKKAAAKKPAAKKAPAKEAPAKEAPAKEAPAKKVAAKKAAAKKPAAEPAPKKVAAKKTAAKKPAAAPAPKKVAAKKTAAKKTSTSEAPAKKVAAKKKSAEKAPAKKATAKKSTSKKTSSKR